MTNGTNPQNEIDAIRAEAIRIQSEMDFASLKGIGHPKFEGQSKILPMVFTLLRHVDRLSAELSAERGRRVEVEGALRLFVDRPWMKCLSDDLSENHLISMDVRVADLRRARAALNQEGGQ